MAPPRPNIFASCFKGQVRCNCQLLLVPWLMVIWVLDLRRQNRELDFRVSWEPFQAITGHETTMCVETFLAGQLKRLKRGFMWRLLCWRGLWESALGHALALPCDRITPGSLLLSSRHLDITRDCVLMSPSCSGGRSSSTKKLEAKEQPTNRASLWIFSISDTAYQLTWQDIWETFRGVWLSCREKLLICAAFWWIDQVSRLGCQRCHQWLNWPLICILGCVCVCVFYSYV